MGLIFYVAVNMLDAATACRTLQIGQVGWLESGRRSVLCILSPPVHVRNGTTSALVVEREERQERLEMTSCNKYSYALLNCMRRGMYDRFELQHIVHCAVPDTWSFIALLTGERKIGEIQPRR